MNKGLALITAVSAAAIAVPASAQEADSAFSGPWVEGLIGYDNSRAGSTVDNDNTDENFDDVVFNDGINGLNYGVGAGYDFDAGGVVLGVEGEWMKSSADTRYDSNSDVGLNFANLDTGRDLYVGARIGAKLSPRTMIYAKGGYTNAKYNILTNDGSTDTHNNVKLDGWRAGAGVEYAISRHAFVKAEYRYSNYTDGQIQFPNGSETGNFDVDVDRHQGVVGVGLRF